MDFLLLRSMFPTHHLELKEQTDDGITRQVIYVDGVKMRVRWNPGEVAKISEHHGIDAEAELMKALVHEIWISLRIAVVEKEMGRPVGFEALRQIRASALELPVTA